MSPVDKRVGNVRNNDPAPIDGSAKRALRPETLGLPQLEILPNGYFDRAHMA
jgi:hypothetical protein